MSIHLTGIYPAINAIIPVIIITTIATYNSQIAKAGNSSKIIRKIIARPTSDPPLACCVSTMFSPPIFLIFYNNLYDSITVYILWFFLIFADYDGTCIF
jgi:hypothetical protein